MTVGSQFSAVGSEDCQIEARGFMFESTGGVGSKAEGVVFFLLEVKLARQRLALIRRTC